MSDAFTVFADREYETSAGKCGECRGTGYLRYNDFPGVTPNSSDSAGCPACRGTGERRER